MRKKKVINIINLVIVVVFILAGILSAGKIFRQKREMAVLSVPMPDGLQVSEILKNEKESENPADICFYGELGLVQAEQKMYGRSADVWGAVLSGDSTVFDWRISGFGEDDTEGCVIDERTARELFGSCEPGGQLTVLDKHFVVRNVLPVKQRVLYIRSQKENNISFQRLYARNNIKDVLLRNALSGKVIGGSGNWIPGEWSDFGFWVEKIRELRENIRIYFMLSKTPLETEMLLNIWKMVFFLLAGIIYCIKTAPFFHDFVEEKNKYLVRYKKR